MTESGLNTVAVTSYMADSSRPSYIGMISFNNQKNKIAYTCGLSGDFRGIILAGFDMNTGSLSNPVKIHDGDIYDVVFSPNGKYLYATDIFAGCVLYKFDLLNRSNDKVLFEKGGNYAFNAIEEGPDGKIYLAIESDNSIGQIAKPDLENEEFNATFLQYSHPTKVGAGLQSTHYFKQIIRERKVQNELGKDTIVCDSININIVLDSGLDQTKWSDGSLGRNLLVTKAGKYYYYFRDCGILYTDTINIQYEEQIIRTEVFNDAFCNGDSLVLTTDRNEAIWNNGEISDKIIVRKEGLYFASYLDGCYMEIKRYDIKIDTFLQPPPQGDTIYCNTSSLSINISVPFKLFDDQRNEIELVNNPSLNGNYFIIGQNTCGLIEKPFKIAVDTFPDLPKDSLIVCTLQEFPLLVKTNVSSTIWDNAYISKQFTINQPGIYSYYLNNSCGEFSSKINVLMSNIKVLPNIFSPNGDGINDYFPGLNFSVYFSLSVFDRWGNLIFEGNDDWDGNYKGNHTESGVYTFILRPKSCENIINGTITLIK
ncbi:MAG: gliding motility-associated C-terminal domain-containing protein [Saprospiraceae bacterium]|nr:gliding motility-associated C-terminal domain-containing protein [Saprospiraceae bacterium]